MYWTASQLLRRSMSSPEGLLLSEMAGGTGGSQEPRHPGTDFSVTLEDVQRFKVLRQRSVCSNGSAYDG